MNNNASPFLIFPALGLVAGLCSGLSVILQPLGVILPGILFGSAISQAVHTSLNPLSPWQRISLIGTTTAAYLISIVTCLLSMRFPGFDNGLLSGACSGAAAGGVGALVVAVPLVIVARAALKPRSTLVTVTIAGAVFGCLFMIVGVYISDHTAVGHPVDDIVSFPLWQVGVASVIPLFRQRPTSSLHES